MSFDESDFGPASCPRAKPEPCAADELADDVDAGAVPPEAFFASAEAVVLELQGMPKPELAAELAGENSPARFDPSGWSAPAEVETWPPSPLKPRFCRRSLGYGASCSTTGWVKGSDPPDADDGPWFLDDVAVPSDSGLTSSVWPPGLPSPAIERARSRRNDHAVLIAARRSGLIPLARVGGGRGASIPRRGARPGLAKTRALCWAAARGSRRQTCAF